MRVTYASRMQVATLYALSLALAIVSNVGVIEVAASTTGELEIVSSPAGDQFNWLLQTINQGADELTTSIVEEHFHAHFLAAFSPAMVIALIQNAATAWDPIEVDGVILQTDDLVHVQARGRDGAMVMIAHSVEHTNDKIAGAIVQPGDLSEATPAA